MSRNPEKHLPRKKQHEKSKSTYPKPIFFVGVVLYHLLVPSTLECATHFVKQTGDNYNNHMTSG